MAARTETQRNGRRRSTSTSPDPQMDASAPPIQEFGTLRSLPIGLSNKAKTSSCTALNEILADSMVLYALYKKNHWLVAGPTFYQLHLLFDKHAGEQSDLVDKVAERIQLLGGVSVAMAHDVAETIIPRVPRGREEVPVQISRLLHAHEIVLEEARAMARRAADGGDDGTNDLLVSDVIRYEPDLKLVGSRPIRSAPSPTPSSRK